MIAEAQGDVEILGCCYFNFTSDRLRRYKGNKPEDIDLDQVTKGLTAYNAELLRAAANALIQGSTSADIIKIAMVRLHEVLLNY